MRLSWNLVLGLTTLVLMPACQTTQSIPQKETNTEQPQPEVLENTDTARYNLRAAKDLADDEYDALKNHKAQAIATALTTTLSNNKNAKTADSPLEFTNNAHGQPNPVAAALAALATCEEARDTRLTPTSACEIRRRNDQIIHSTPELMHGLDADRPAFIWQLQHKDNRVYLAGSIHVLKPTLKPPPSYELAFERSGTLVLEVDQRSLPPETIALLVQRYSVLPENLRLHDLLEQKELQKVQEYLGTWGIPTEVANRTKPAMLLLQAGVFEYVSMGYLAQHGIDSVFEQRKGNRPLIGLETMEQQLNAATALPLQLQADLLVETIAEAEETSDQISTLVHAWLSGNPDYLSSQFDNATDSEAAKQWLDDLLAKRNVGMAKSIADFLRGSDPRIIQDQDSLQPQPIFVIVGAAHLVGKGSVVDLLEQQGFSAQRLSYDSLQPIN